MRKWSLVIVLLALSLVCTSQITLDANTIIEDINNGKSVNYDGVTFNGDLDFTKVNNLDFTQDKNKFPNAKKKEIRHIVNAPLVFNNCIFKGNIISSAGDSESKEYHSTQFNNKLILTNCTSSKVSFKYGDFNENISMNSCSFSDIFELKYSNIMKNIELDNCNFNGGIKIKYAGVQGILNIINSKIKENADFKYTGFKKETYFKSNEFDCIVSFAYSKFSEKLEIDNCNFLKGVDFKYDEFEGLTIINQCKFDVLASFRYSIFSKEARFNSDEFYCDANFKYSEFKNEMNFENTVFYSDANFDYGKYNEKKLYLNGAIFKGTKKFTPEINNNLDKYLAKSSPFTKTDESNNNKTFISDNTQVNNIKPSAPAVLEIKNIVFTDENNNNQIDGVEKCKIEFEISNMGKGSANQLSISIHDNASINGLLFNKTKSISSIPPASSQKVVLNLFGSVDLTSGLSDIQFDFQEINGFPPESFHVKIPTHEFLKPQLIVVDNSFSSDEGVIKLGIPIKLKALVQNIGKGVANNVEVNFQYPASNVYPVGEANFKLGTMKSGESREVIFDFFTNKLYESNDIPIQVVINEEFKRFSENKLLTAKLNTETNKTNNNIVLRSKAINESQSSVQIASLSSDVDKGIPVNAIQQKHTYALIIGNEDYQSKQTSLSVEQNVDFALNDAEIFALYCENTLGVPKKQIKVLKNATSVEIQQALSWINNLSKLESGNAKLIFYYSGHGLPHEQTKEPYLIPVDVSGTNIEYGIKLTDVYQKLTEFPAKQVTVLLDACFSGGARNQGLIAMKGIRVKPKENVVNGNVVVFSSSSGEESSAIYEEKQHGYFTYFLLKKLKETNGDVSLESLGNYIIQNVSKEAALNSKMQTPQVNASYQISEDWKTWKLK